MQLISLGTHEVLNVRQEKGQSRRAQKNNYLKLSKKTFSRKSAVTLTKIKIIGIKKNHTDKT
jgi:hypothetical protein